MKYLLVKIYLKSLSILALLGLPFFLIHNSNKPILGNYSLSFIFLLLIPYFLILIFLLIELKPIYTKDYKVFKENGNKYHLLNTLFIFLLLSWVYFFWIIKIDYVGTFMFLFSSCLLFYILQKTLKILEILLIGTPIMIFSMILLFSELMFLSFNLVFPESFEKNKIVYWGDTKTFKSLSNNEYPFISKGGRLLPNLRVKMFNPYHPKGVSLITNSIGFRNHDNYDSTKLISKFRILSLGDSFSNGYHVDQKDFFGYVLESVLRKKTNSDNIEILNVEVSDPAFGSVYLSNYINYWKPDLILYGTYSNDVIQTEAVFGKDKLFYFDNDGNLMSNENVDLLKSSYIEKFSDLKFPKKAQIVSSNSIILQNFKSRVNKFYLTRKVKALFKSLIFIDNVKVYSYAEKYETLDGHKRYFDGSNNFGLFYKRDKNRITNLYKPFFKSLSHINRICNDSGAIFALINHPMRYQVQNGDWDLLADRWSLNKSDFDLRLHNKRIQKFCKNENIIFIDPINDFISNKKKLYQPNDSHYNREGHYIAAKSAANEIIKIIDKD